MALKYLSSVKFISSSKQLESNDRLLGVSFELFCDGNDEDGNDDDDDDDDDEFSAIDVDTYTGCNDERLFDTLLELLSSSSESMRSIILLFILASSMRLFNTSSNDISSVTCISSSL